jgi:hypothetical protein
MSLRTSSSKRQRREGDDQREEQSFTVNDFEFENLVTQFVGGMALISYQKPKEQEKVMICVKDPKLSSGKSRRGSSLKLSMRWTWAKQTRHSKA